MVSIRECKFSKSQNHVLFVIFRAEIVGGEIQIRRPDEISEIAWIDIDKANELLPFYNNGIQGMLNGHEISYVNEGIK